MRRRFELAVVVPAVIITIRRQENHSTLERKRFYLKTWPTLELSNLTWENIAIKSGCRAFFKIVNTVEAPSLQQVALFLCSLSFLVQENQAEQAMISKAESSTPPWCLHQLLVSGSCAVWVSVLLSEERWCGRASQINAFLHKLTWSWCFTIETVTLARAPLHVKKIQITWLLF